MEYEDDFPQPWWRRLLSGLGVLAGLLLLGAVSFGVISLVAKYFVTEQSAELPISIDLTPPKAEEQNAKTRVTPPYGPEAWPSNPGRGAGVSFKGATGGRNGNAAASATAPAAAGQSVGMSVDEYRAAVDSGKKVYLPNPQGECDLSGASSAQSLNALENCFAQRAGR